MALSAPFTVLRASSDRTIAAIVDGSIALCGPRDRGVYSATLSSSISAAGVATVASGSFRVAVTTNDKTLHILTPSESNPADFTLQTADSTKLARRASSLEIVQLNDTIVHAAGEGRPGIGGEEVILVGDKVGDVTAYSLHAPSSKKRHLLNHFGSIITAVTAVPWSSLRAAVPGPAPAGVEGQGFLLTADRDEKIRVSRWPTAASIVSYCLGHTRFTSLLHVVHHPTVASANTHAYPPQSLLVSGGGDSALRLWHIASGTLLHSLYLRSDGTASASVGAHEDADMSESAEAGEGPGEKPSKLARGSQAKRARVQAETGAGQVDGASCGEHAEMDGENPDNDMEEVEEIEEDDRAGGSASAPTLRIPGTALGITLQPALPPRVPVSVIDLGPSEEEALGHGRGMLLATFVHGERCVRFITVTLGVDASGAMPSVHVGEFNRDATGGAENLPQPRLHQVGIVQLPFPPLSLLAYEITAASSSSSPRPVLLVLTVAELEDKAGRGRYCVTPYEVSGHSEGGQGAMHMEEREMKGDLAFLQGFNAVLATANFTPSDGLDLAAGREPVQAGQGPIFGHGCTATSLLNDKGEFDKSAVATVL